MRLTSPADDCFVLPAPMAAGPLLAWLLDALKPMNRTRVKQLLRHGLVSVNGATTSRHDYPLRPGDQVAIVRASSAPADRSLKEAGISIVWEDNALIVIDKPPGLLSVAPPSERTDTAIARLNAHLKLRGPGRPLVIHRPDPDTT